MISKISTIQERRDHFIDRAREKFGDRYDYSLVDYRGSEINVLICCSIHGRFTQRPNNHLNSKEGCYRCGKNRAGLNHRLSQEEFIRRANKIHHNFYNYNTTEYVGSFIPVTITCPIHGNFKQQPNDHLFHETGCKQCGYINRMSKGERHIAHFLTKHNIIFIVQHTFADLKALDNTTPLRYDFYLPNENILIEFDGPHHIEPTTYPGTTRDSAVITHERTVTYDIMKNDYAKKKGMQIIRIPFKELKNIYQILQTILFKN